MSNFAARTSCNLMRLHPLCARQTHLVCSFIVIAHWNNSRQVDRMFHSNTSFWFRVDHSLFLLLSVVFSREEANINFMVLGLTRMGFEPTIYRIRCEHVNHYTTDAVHIALSNNKSINQWYQIVNTQTAT